MSLLRPTKEDIGQYALALKNLFEQVKFSQAADIRSAHFEKYNISADPEGMHSILIYPDERMKNATMVVYDINTGRDEVTPLRLKITPHGWQCPLYIDSVDKPAEGYSRVGSGRYQNNVWVKNFHPFGVEAFKSELERLAANSFATI